MSDEGNRSENSTYDRNESMAVIVHNNHASSISLSVERRYTRFQTRMDQGSR